MHNCLSMQPNYCKITKTFYDHAGSVIVPDANGIIAITVEGVQKRYAVDKLVAYLERNGTFPGTTIRVNREIPKPKRYKSPHGSGTQRKWQKVTERKGRPGVKVLATDAQGKQFGPYNSVCHASKELNIAKSIISKAVNGVTAYTKSFTFFKV